jgi:hypothetical protein
MDHSRELDNFTLRRPKDTHRLARITSTIASQEGVATVVEDRASALDSLIAGEAPVVSGVDCSRLSE